MRAHDLTGHSWHRQDYDVDVYLARLGVGRSAPGAGLLEELHQAHVRTIPFANVDILLGSHPGVAPAAVQRQLVDRRRGGYCFEHSQLFAAAAQDLGFAVRRRLGRVHSPTNTRTHMSVAVAADGEWFLADPGFGYSIRGPIPLEDGARRDDGGRVFALTSDRAEEGSQSWSLRRDGELQHVCDTLPVQPVDVHTGHIITSTRTELGPFTRKLMVARHTESGHVTVTENTRTVRADGRPTTHESITAAEAVEAVRELGIDLVDDEPARLRSVLATLATPA